MNARSHVSTATILLGLASIFGTGCGAAPDGAEPSANGNDALLKPPRGAASVELPQASCSWDAMEWDVHGAHQDPGVGFYGASIGWGSYVAHASPSSCVPSAVDALTYAERVLMAAGCSQPFYWESWDLLQGRNAGISDAQWAECQSQPSFGCYDEEVNAIFMMCPLDGSVGGYPMSTFLEGRIPATVYNGVPTDELPNWAWAVDYYDHVMGPTGAFFDTVVPRPPSGYGWARLWADPHGCVGGCMTKI